MGKIDSKSYNFMMEYDLKRLERFRRVGDTNTHTDIEPATQIPVLSDYSNLCTMVIHHMDLKKSDDVL